MAEKTPDLNAAYALETPQDNRELYADWAQTYDADFAEQMDYQMPRLVATIYEEIAGGAGPVLDVGAGTGLVADHMTTGRVVDALDISPQMLEVAMAKGRYRRAIEADLTGPLVLEDGVYGGIVSSGTFTHGHVGPDALDELLRVARQGAQFVLGVNAEHFEARGFGDKFAALAPVIDGYAQRMINIYGEGADAAHRDDQACVVLFTKR